MLRKVKLALASTLGLQRAGHSEKNRLKRTMPRSRGRQPRDYIAGGRLVPSLLSPKDEIPNKNESVKNAYPAEAVTYPDHETLGSRPTITSRQTRALGIVTT